MSVRSLVLLALAATGAACKSPESGGGAGSSGTGRASARFALPRSERFVYASGATLTVVPSRELPLVSVLIVAEGGARLEPEGKAGLARFTADLLEEGPAGTTRPQFLAAIDRLGARFATNGSLDDVTLSLDFMARDLNAGLELLLGAALEPGFDEAAVARARERTLAELVAAREDEARIARDVLYSRLFPDSRYGKPLAGTPESVASFTLADARGFRHAAFEPRRLRVIVVGDVDPAEVGLAVARAASHRGVELGVAGADSLPAFAPRGRDGAPWPRRELVLVHKPGVVQPQVVFGCRGTDATHADFNLLRAANVPFGGGFTSWLVERLRVDLGLTYSAGSAVVPLADGGLFLVRSFSKSTTIGELLAEAFALQDRLAGGGLDQPALERARLALCTRTVETMETTSGVAELVKQEQILGLGADSVARLSRELDAMTLAQLQAAIAKHLPDSQHVLCVVVGDEAQIGEQLRKLGPVEVVDYRSFAPLAGGGAAGRE